MSPSGKSTCPPVNRTVNGRVLDRISVYPGPSLQRASLDAVADCHRTDARILSAVLPDATKSLNLTVVITEIEIHIFSNANAVKTTPCFR